MKYCSLHRRYFTVEHLSCKSSYLWKSMWQWTFLCIYKSHSFQRKPFIPPPSPFQALHSTCLFCMVYNYILSMKFSYLVLFLAAVPCVKPHASLCYLLHPPFTSSKVETPWLILVLMSPGFSWGIYKACPQGDLNFSRSCVHQVCTLSTDIIQVVHQVLKCSKMTKNELLTKAPLTSFVFLVLRCYTSRQMHVSESHHSSTEHLCLASLLCLLPHSSPTLLLWP